MNAKNKTQEHLAEWKHAKFSSPFVVTEQQQRDDDDDDEKNEKKGIIQKRAQMRK